MFDNNEHPEKTKPFWNAVERGEVRIVVSDLLGDELEGAPKHVRDFFARLPESQIEQIASTEESDNLAAQYIAAQVVGEKALTIASMLPLPRLPGQTLLSVGISGILLNSTEFIDITPSTCSMATLSSKSEPPTR